MQKAVAMGISFTERHLRVLDRWSATSGISRSELVRMLIEDRADCKLKRRGLFWKWERPEWQRGNDG